MVANLLNNAAKYTEDGGYIEVEAYAEAETGQAVICVRDSGIGIDAALLPEIFDLFAQGERSLDRSQGGLGIGLTLVQRIVALHFGEVTASSLGLGHGAEFRVSLPCISAVESPVMASTARADTGSAPQGLRVVVVDDNADAAESVAVFLGLNGHEVKTLPDGFQVLASAEVFAPQVYVIDIGLPGMSGHELATRLREMPVARDALLIALTGYGQKEDQMQAL